ncbi:AAA family ATPase [Brevibacterium album]|uniref:AAA family ATPase n=1 Tax=Brevibacterium album TaxID=417948 RepID=UPI0012EBA2BA|nr:AAA family ATPase [Brevibacterium album]
MPDTAADVVLLAGVPGAGKTHTARTVAAMRPDVRIADPEPLRTRIAAHVPGLPYRAWRPVLHALAHIAASAQLLRAGSSPLVVHDTGTRTWSRRLFLCAAALRGLRTAAVFIDAGRAEALAGQRARRRLVRPRAFARHWRRWEALRTRLAAGLPPSAHERWGEVRLVTREEAPQAVMNLLAADRRRRAPQ